MSQNLENSQLVVNELPENIAKEFSVDEKTGQVFLSRRGIARLSGVTEGSIRKLLKAIAEGGNHAENKSAYQKLPKNLQPFTGTSFDSAYQIPDLLASAIIKYYDRQGNEVAQYTSDAIGAVGLRTIGQKLTGWKEPVTLTKQQIIELLVLPVPTEWEPRFSDEFYKEMSRLTNLKASGHLRPQLWGRLTAEWVYNYLPTGVYQEVKAWQLATDPTNKLHQYLSPEGIKVLKKQLTLVSNIMQSAGHWREVSQLVDQAATKTYQCSIFYSTKTR